MFALTTPKQKPGTSWPRLSGSAGGARRGLGTKGLRGLARMSLFPPPLEEERRLAQIGALRFSSLCRILPLPCLSPDAPVCIVA